MTARSLPRAVDTLEQRTAKKFRSFARRGTVRGRFLHRHSGADGDLLYIGIAMSAVVRNCTHIASSDWSGQIHRIIIEPFETRVAALAAEREAIQNELPRFNKRPVEVAA
jgi:hypothetical protein